MYRAIEADVHATDQPANTGKILRTFSLLGGLAHGASLHHELQLLVAAGRQPEEALRAATSTPARRFGLADRGRIVLGALADLLLVDGDPTATISDTFPSGKHGGVASARPRPEPDYSYWRTVGAGCSLTRE